MAVKRNSSLRRTLEITRVLGTKGDGSRLRAVDIIDAVGAERSQVSRSLRQLQDFGLVDRDSDRRYGLSWRWRVAASRASGPMLLAAAPDVLETLASAFDETAYLSVLSGTEVATILVRASTSGVSHDTWVGQTVPASCTSSGRAMLSTLSDAEIRERYEGVALPTPTVHAPRDLAHLLERLHVERAMRTSIAHEELEIGLLGVGAAVVDFEGRAVAAVNVGGPAVRLERRVTDLVTSIREAADDLARSIGADPHSASGDAEGLR